MKNGLSKNTLQQRLEAELKKISDDVTLLPEINHSNEFARPFIEIDELGYHYVCRERGEEIFRKFPFDTEELVFEVFADITFSLASEWELKNRDPNEDFRLRLFKKQVELMTRINSDFGKKLNEQLARLLKDI